MALNLLSSDTERTLTGVILIVVATMLLLSGLNLFFDFTYFFSQEVDIVLSFVAIIFGVTLILSEKNET